MSINGPNGLTVEIPDQVAEAWREIFQDPPLTIADIQRRLGFAEDGSPLLPCEMCSASATCDGSDCIQMSASSVDDVA